MTTHPRVDPISQFDDPTTTADGTNCTSASFCMLGELAAGKRMFPGAFRRLQSDQSGGISIPDGARAWPRAFPSARLQWSAPNDGTPIPAIREGDSLDPEDAWSLLSAGYGMVMQGDYEVFDDAGVGLQPGFRDPHAVYVDGVRVVTKARQAYMLDPIGRGEYRGRWIDWALLIKYARRLTGTTGVYAAWALPAVPDTDTETDMPARSFRFDSSARSGNLVVVGPNHTYVRLATAQNIAIPAGTPKRAFGPVTLVDQAGKPIGPGGPADTRTKGYIVNDEAAFLIEADVKFTADIGDVKRKVALAVDGKIDPTTERAV